MYIHSGILATKKNKIMPFKANRLEIEVIMLSIISHTLKDEYHVFSDMQNRDFRGKKKKP